MWTLQNERNRNVQIKIYEREYGFPKNGFRAYYYIDLFEITEQNLKDRFWSRFQKTVVEIVWRKLQSFSSVPA